MLVSPRAGRTPMSGGSTTCWRRTGIWWWPCWRPRHRRSTSRTTRSWPTRSTGSTSPARSNGPYAVSPASRFRRRSRSRSPWSSAWPSSPSGCSPRTGSRPGRRSCARSPTACGKDCPMTNRTPERTRPPAEFRRGSTEVRTLLLEAARFLFAAKGYAGATTHDIAAQAGVSEALLFRHFGTKASLFERAVIDPINEFVSRYVEEWAARPGTKHDMEGLVFAYVDGFYRLLLEHGDLVLALITAQAYEAIDGVDGASPLSRL